MQESERHDGFEDGHIAPAPMPAPPRRKLAVLTCMDARIDLDALLDLKLGDAHVIRNAGGIATDDVIRSLAGSQRLLETEEILVIQHTDCGVHRITPQEFAAQIGADTGETPDWDVPVTDSPATTLAMTLEILRNSKALPRRDRIRGAVLNLATGDLIDEEAVGS